VLKPLFFQGYCNCSAISNAVLRGRHIDTCGSRAYNTHANSCCHRGVNQAPARHGGPFHRRSTAHRFERARLHSGSRAVYRSRSAPRQAGNGLTGQGGSRNMSFASRLRYWVRVSSRRFPIPRSSPTRVPRRRQRAGPVSGDIPMRTLAAFLTPPVAGAGADGSAGETA
jgi:hypothetical protein